MRRSPALEEPHFFQRHGHGCSSTTPASPSSALGGVDRARRRAHRPLTRPTRGGRATARGASVRSARRPAGAPVGARSSSGCGRRSTSRRCSTHFDVNEFADGRRWHEFGALAPVGDGEADVARTVDWRVEWRPGTRWAASFEYDLIGWGGEVTTVRLMPRYEFQMRGIGYGHPTLPPRRVAGRVRGGRRAAGAARRRRRATRRTSTSRRSSTPPSSAPAATVEHGIGILEQLAIGAHPSGLSGIADPA